MPLLNEFETPDLLHRVVETIDTLRRMRLAGSVYDWLDSCTIPPKKVVEDAMILAGSASSCLVARLFQRETPDSYTSWAVNLRDLAAKYHYYSMVHSGGQSDLVAASRVLTRLQLQYRDRNFLGAAGLYLNNNNITFLHVRDMMTVGILAPLSTDYLAACCFSEFLRQRFSADFPLVQPVLLDANKEEVPLGDDKSDRPLLAVQRVVILLDTGSTGATMKTMDAIARRQYPNQYTSQLRKEWLGI